MNGVETRGEKEFYAAILLGGTHWGKEELLQTHMPLLKL